MNEDFYVPIDMHGLEIQNHRLHMLSSDPASPNEGDIWFNTTNDDPRVRVQKGSTLSNRDLIADDDDFYNRLNEVSTIQDTDYLLIWDDSASQLDHQNQYRRIAKSNLFSGISTILNAYTGLIVQAGISPLNASGADDLRLYADNTILQTVGSQPSGNNQVDLTWLNQSPNLILSGPPSGGAAPPTFRSLTDDDMPTSYDPDLWNQAGVETFWLRDTSGDPYLYPETSGDDLRLDGKILLYHITDNDEGFITRTIHERFTGQTASKSDNIEDRQGWFYNNAGTPELIQGTSFRSVVSDIVDGTEEARFEFWSLNTTLTRALSISSRYGMELHSGNFVIPATSKIYFDGGGDTYIYESTGDTLNFYAGGEHIFRIRSAAPEWRMSVAGGAAIVNAAATETVPVFTFEDDTDTGIGSADGDNLSLIAGGNQIVRINNSYMMVDTINELTGAAGVTIEGTLINAGTIYFDYSGDPNTYLQRVSADTVYMYAGGNISFIFSGTNQSRSIIPTGTDTYDLGLAVTRWWRDVYAQKYYVDDASAYISYSGTELQFTDGVTGTKTLAQLAATIPMVYPGAGIALSTGSAWGTSITNNSANWNTAYSHSQIITGNPHALDYSDVGAAAVSHTHGNITNAGAIGSTTNLPIITTTSGVLIASSFGTGANTFCVGNDARLSDARTPTAHAMDSATYHTSSDVTTLDATTSKHGFLPKLGGGTTNYLRADGAWAAPPGGTTYNSGSGITVDGSDNIDWGGALDADVTITGLYNIILGTVAYPIDNFIVNTVNGGLFGSGASTANTWKTFNTTSSAQVTPSITIQTGNITNAGSTYDPGDIKLAAGTTTGSGTNGSIYFLSNTSVYSRTGTPAYYVTMTSVGEIIRTTYAAPGTPAYGADNQIPYMNSTTGFQYSAKLIFDDNRLGISGSSTTDNRSPSITYIGQESDFLYNTVYVQNYGFGFHIPSDHASNRGAYISGYYGVDIFTAGAFAVRVNSSGYVGIGTTSPDYTLDVVGDSGYGRVVFSDKETVSTAKSFRLLGRHYDAAGSTYCTALFQSSDGTDNFVRVGGGTSAGYAATKIKFYAAANDTTATGSQIATFDINGLSLGTANPTHGKLHITHGSVPVVYHQSTVDSYIRLVHDGSSPQVRWDWSITGGVAFTTTETALKMYKDGAVEAFYNGGLRIATTAAGATVTGALQVNADNSAGYAATFDQTHATAHGILVNIDATSGTTYTLFRGYRDTTKIAELRSDGDWWAADFINSSDRILKDVYFTVEDGLERVMKLNPVTFRWKDHSDDFIHTGFIAQEVQKLYPELVKEGSDGLLSLSYGKMSAIAIAGVQGLNCKVDTIEDTLRKEIVDLKNRVKQLENGENT